MSELILTNKSFKASITLVMLLFSFTLFAQKKNVTHGDQQWIQYYNQSVLSKNFTLLTDGGFRWKNSFNEKSQYLVRTGLGYNLDSNTRITAGIAFLGFYNENAIFRTEKRPYQEILIRNKFKSLKITHRFRSEQRFFSYPDNINTGFNHRFRYRIMLDLPLFSLSPSNTDKKVSVTLGDEILLNAGKEVVFNIFSQNRFLIGTSIPINKNLSISLLYYLAYSKSNSPNDYQQNNNVWLGIKHKLNFTKKSHDTEIDH